MFVRAVTLAPYHQIINALIPSMFWGIMFKAMLVLELSGGLCVDRYGDVSGRMLATAKFRIRIYRVSERGISPIARVKKAIEQER